MPRTNRLDHLIKGFMERTEGCIVDQRYRASCGTKWPVSSSQLLLLEVVWPCPFLSIPSPGDLIPTES